MLQDGCCRKDTTYTAGIRRWRFWSPIRWGVPVAGCALPANGCMISRASAWILISNLWNQRKHGIRNCVGWCAILKRMRSLGISWLLEATRWWVRTRRSATYLMPSIRWRSGNEKPTRVVPKGRSTLSYNGSAWVLACLPTCLSESRTN